MVAVVAAQEVQWVFSTKNRATKPGAVNYDFVNDGRRVGVYYFYVFDRELRARVHQDLDVLPLSCQGLVERPRVGSVKPPTTRSGSPR